MPNRYRIDGATNITGSLTITGSVIATSFSGSFSGSGADLSGIPASSITGLNLSQIATGSITAAVNVNSASFAITSGSSTFLFVSSSGNVGIGTTTPTEKIHIVKESQPSTREPILKAQISDAGNDAFFIGNGTILDNVFLPQFAGFGSNGGAVGRAGISFAGIVNPTSDVVGDGLSSAVEFRTFKVPIGTDPLNEVRSDISNKTLFSFFNNSTAIMGMFPNGNIHIGLPLTTTPIARLDVSGSGRFTDNLTVTGSAIISSSNATQMLVGSNLLFVSSSGRVGIGTTTPTTTLDVSGSGRFTNTLTITGSLITTTTARFAGSDGSTGTYIDSNGTLSIYRSINGVTYGLRVFNGAGWLGHDAILGIAYRYPIYGAQGSNGMVQASPLDAGSGVFGRGGVGVTGQGVTPSGDVGSIGLMGTSLFINSALNTTLYDRQAAAQIIGLGTTTGTALKIQNSSNQLIFSALDNRSVGIGRIPTASLDVAGTTRLSGSFNTATSGSILTVIGSGSAQPIFTVQGSQGELFSVVDSLSGSLFSVNDVSGLPIMEVFSDNSIVMGNYLDPMLITTVYTGSVASGSHILYRLPTSSYDGFWFEYTVRSGSNARAGQMMGIWSGSAVNYTETTTTDFGTTTGINLMSTITGSNMIISASTATSGWTIKGIVRSI